MRLERGIAFVLTAVLLVFLVACGGTAGEATPDHDEAQMDEMDHDDDEMEMGAARVPNDGRLIRLLSPADGATFAADEEVVVEVTTENFVLGQDGNHWHVFIDGSSWGMITGGDSETILRGIEPGAHKLEVYIANGDHEEYAEGDAVTITVEE